jgi:hypothetical protein
MEIARDYYATLGVDRDADAAAIRLAYRTLMRCTHPDVNQSHDAGSRASAINEAYTCLHDPVKRAAYDGWRKAQRAVRRAVPVPPPLHEFNPTWPAHHLDKFNEDQVIRRKWKLISLGLAAIVTIITFTMTSAVDTSGPPPEIVMVPAAPLASAPPLAQ